MFLHFKAVPNLIGNRIYGQIIFKNLIKAEFNRTFKDYWCIKTINSKIWYNFEVKQRLKDGNTPTPNKQNSSL